MKALTICQPYAELIARGEKEIENRTWATSYRGPLAIHAGKSKAWLDPEDRTHYPGMVFGAVVALATLRGCIRIEDLPLEYRGSAHANGPWCWILIDVRRIEPVPCKGAQGLWDWEPPRALSPDFISTVPPTAGTRALTLDVLREAAANLTVTPHGSPRAIDAKEGQES